MMTTAFQLNADDLDAAFVERVKAAFPHKLIVEAGRNVVVPDQSQFR